MDDLDTQKKFAQSLNLPFPLAADPKGEAAEAFGVKNGSHASRVTFVIDPEGKVVKVVQGSDALDPDPALQACPLHKQDRDKKKT
jgi:peroxiredoxin